MLALNKLALSAKINGDSLIKYDYINIFRIILLVILTLYKLTHTIACLF